MTVEGFHFDMTVNVTHIITLFGFLGVGVIFFLNIKSTLTLFGYRLDIIDATMENLQRDYINGKVQDNEIARLKEDGVIMRKEIYDLRVGKGFVQSTERGLGVDGMYTRAGKIPEQL